MSAFDNSKNMYHAKLKPRMLRRLIRENFPAENEPSGIPAELSNIVSLIRTHELLSEYFDGFIDQKVADSWKSAVDEWVAAVLSLVSSNMSNKCWIGICLLGVTCQECVADRFLASYSVWFDKIYSHIQQALESQFVKVASLNTMSDLLTRLDALPNAKKDGSSLAGKLIQPLLKLLNEDGSEVVWEGVVHLLCTILTSFPTSVHRYHENVEVAIASKLFSGKCSVNMMKKLAYCLALLPKSKGDDDSWCLMMQKILLLINAHLNDVFLGLEEETKGSEAIRALVPPGKDPPPPLGGHTLSGEAIENGTKQLPISSISMLIVCCSLMLTSSYPVQVTVPILPLLALVDRVVMVDGSIPCAVLPYMTGMQQEFVCLELPVLHLHSLELLISIIDGARSQLLPHAAFIVRLVKQYFKRCSLPELRIKLYSITKSLLIYMGAGMAVYFAQEVVNNAFLDLNPVGDESGFTAFATNLKTTSPVQSSHRKRKHGTITGSFEQQNNKIALEEEAPKNCVTSPISLKIAALEAVEVLLTMGGGLRSESWRPTIDLLLINLATNCCKEGWGKEDKNTFLPGDLTLTWADFQLVALRALLASLLSPARVRHPYLARALELFRRGKWQAGTKLAGFCAHALLTLEVLLHPRALPVEDFPSANYNSFDKVNHRFSANEFFGGQKQSIPYSSGIQGMGQGPPDSDDDELYDKWVGNDTDIQSPVHGPSKNLNDVVKPPESLGVNWTEKLHMAGLSGTKILESSKEQADVGMRNNDDDIMIDSQQFQEIISSKVVTDPVITDNLEGPEMETEKAVPDSGLDNNYHQTASADDFLAGKGDGLSNVDRNAPLTTFTEKGKSSVFDLDDDSSSDSFPDIVDVDPDSDAEKSG